MPALFLSPALVEFVFGVKLLGFGALVCLLPVTNFDSALDFALATETPWLIILFALK